MRWFLAALFMLWSNAAMAAEPYQGDAPGRRQSAAAYHDWKLTTQIREARAGRDRPV